MTRSQEMSRVAVATSVGQAPDVVRSRLGTDLIQIGILVAADLVVIVASTLVAVNGRQVVTVFGNSGSDVEALVRPLAAGIAVGWLLALAVVGSYAPKCLTAGTVEYRRVLSASLGMMAALGIGAYLLNYPLSRAFYFLLFVIGIPALLAVRLLVRRVTHRLRRAGYLQKAILVAGDAEHVHDVVSVMSRERWLGYSVVGILTNDPGSMDPASDIPVLGTPDDAIAALHESGASAVLFAEGSFRRGRHFNEMARQFEDVHAQLMVVPSLTDVSAERLEIRPVAGIPLVHIDAPRARAAGRVGKRAFDIVGSSALLLLGSPLMLGVALAIKLDSRGPVLFKQVRAGLSGEPFECFKFRSMVVDAEARLAELRHLNQTDGVLFKMVDDPRITRVGRVIRRFSLDELPQLMNVWRGDMSLVGPRPALVSEVKRYKDHVLRRLDVRPGMTGLWQVSGRSDLSWDDTVRLDLYYVDNWSMVQDLAILLKTFGAVVGSRGAY